MAFDAAKVKDECVAWIREYFKENGPTCNAIVGISGGKDSTVVAVLCVEALGRDRVIGVLLPQGEQVDINDSYKLVQHLQIRYHVLNIGVAVRDLLLRMALNDIEVSESTKINLPARIRMATLFAISQSNNGRVANTCNLSEDWIGYSTLFGDGAGQFAPLADLTVAEVKAVGRALGIPDELIDKVPADGLCDKTDEENLGFTYDQLDTYIRTGVCKDSEVKEKIDRLHIANRFKFLPMPQFSSGLPIEVPA